MTDETLAVALKKFRTGAGMTQEELADRAAISARTVSDVERGLRIVMHRSTALRLAAALGLDERDQARFNALTSGRLADTRQADTVPVPPTRLLGRSRELESIKARLQDPDIRLLTLTGPGGIGKTRLALEAAVQVRPLFGGGVFFVALGELRDASLVALELAKVVGVAETGAALVELLTRRLAGSQTLVVMDTFEHLMPAVPLIYSMLLKCPQTTFLVTSRSALRLRGEHEFPVPPLELPSASRTTTPEDIHRWPAIALFWERAQAVRPSLNLDPETAALIGQICRKLDGLPLAIELAAARVRHLPLGGILEQLEHRLEFLVGGPLDLPLRQRAIRDTVEWSHDLLGAHEQALFRRLSVFAGDWSLDAVRSIARSVEDDWDPLHGISALVDQNLVVLKTHRQDPRYDMLDVVREFAAARLQDAGETDQTERRHALYYLALAETAEPHLTRTGHQQWFDRLDIDRGNIRRGLARTIDRGETALALRYIVALWRYWRQLGELAEGRRWSDAALAVAGPATPSLRAKALCAAAALAFPQADHQRIAELATEAIELAHRSDDPMDLRNALTIQGFAAMCQGRYADALQPYTEAIAICQELGISWQLATSQLNLATALLHSGRAEEAIAGLHEALRLPRTWRRHLRCPRAQPPRTRRPRARRHRPRRPPRARGARVPR